MSEIAEEIDLWMVGGDLIPFSISRKEGEVGTRDIILWKNLAIFDCGLIDVGFDGCQFTWTDKNIWQHLDRMLFSGEWIEVF